MREALAPILFEEEDIEEIKSSDKSGLLTYKPSAKTNKKARFKRNIEKFTVHSFSTLLKDLGTITHNKIQINLKREPVSFEKITRKNHGSCFLKGDNFLESTDSCSFGLVKPEQILGRVTSRFF